jgi:hypothetical protein
MENLPNISFGYAQDKDKSLETTKKKFIYRDNFKNREVVFECEAESITEADKLLKDSTGIDAYTTNNISCEIISEPEN